MSFGFTYSPLFHHYYAIYIAVLKWYQRCKDGAVLAFGSGSCTWKDETSPVTEYSKLIYFLHSRNGFKGKKK